MNEPGEDLLRALGELEREEFEGPYPEAWEAVLAGRMTATEAEEARASIDSPELQAVYRASFTGPIAEAEILAMVDRVARTAAGEEKVVRPRFGRGVVMGIVAVLAVAAALLLWTIPREAPRGTPVAYSLTVRSPGLHGQRSGDEPDDRYRPDSTVDWVMSPELATQEAVELRVLARDEAGGVRVLAPAVSRSPEGVLRLRGRFAELLGLAPGRWSLRFVVCPAGAGLVEAAAVEAAVAAGRAWEARERLEITALPAV